MNSIDSREGLETAPPAAEIGRPTLFDPIFCKMLVDHMEKGFSFESFAGVAKVARSTIYKWEKEFPEFSDAKNIGKGLSQLFWEKTGIEGLHNETIKTDDGMTVTRSINATLWIFNMKNRFNWRDKQPDEERGDESAGEVYPGMTKDQAAALLKEKK